MLKTKAIPSASQAIEICPNCGYDLELARSFTLGHWTFYGCGTVAYLDRILHTHAPERAILTAIARNAPYPVSLRALADRGMHATDKSVPVFISKLRRHLREIEAPDPIKGQRAADGSYCYFWNDAATAPDATK